ncbi:MAG: flagellar hook-basal body protein, partial [Cellulosilyticaceae bacterium]
MVRALWTAASGMTSQQLNVDTISNNLANANTAGYKRESMTFKSLLYTKMDTPNIPGSPQAPNPMQVGHGVRAGSTTRDYSQGILQETGNPTDMAIEGKGFFAVQNGEQVAYTRDGSFRLAMTEDNAYALVSGNGHPLLSVEGDPILVDSQVKVEDLIIAGDGWMYYNDPETGMRTDIGQIQLVQFANKEGLESVGSNLYIETPASGAPLLEMENEGVLKSNIRSGYLEGSNIQVADEMVKLIVAQRAYELNSTAIKTADTMMQQANELKRV